MTDIGRWRLCNIGSNRITAQIIEEVNDKTANIANEVLFRVTPLVEQLVVDEVDEATAILRKQGGVFYSKKGFSYNINNFLQTFTHKEGDLFGRIFLVNSEHNDPDNPFTESPLKGDLFSDAGGVKIYEENQNLQLNQNYSEVYVKHKRFSELYTIENNKSYRFYTDSMIPQGTLKVRCLSNGTVTASFDLVFPGMSYRDFYITNVVYSPMVKRTGLTSANGYPFFPKFAIVANSVYIGLAVEDTQFCENVEFEYTDINIKPIMEEDNFSNQNSYAIRNGGGSYIRELGEIVTSYKLNTDTAYGSFDFYLFSNGFIAYDKNIVLDRNIYHSYYDMGCLDTFADISNMHFISATESTPIVGTIQQPALPNVEFVGSLTSTQQFELDVDYVEERQWLAGTTKDGFVRLTHNKQNVVSDYDFNANRDCSPIYQAGETTVKTLSLYVNRFLVGY